MPIGALARQGSKTPGGDAETQGYLHLCSADKIWAVKQVSTSNSVYITETEHPNICREKNIRGAEEDVRIDGTGHEVHGVPVANGHGDEEITLDGGISTISQVKNILELVGARIDSAEIEARVRSLVPCYHDSDFDDDVTAPAPEQTHTQSIALSDVVDDIASPTRAIYEALRRLFIFSLPSSHDSIASRLYLAPHALLLRCWKLFMQQSTISEVRLDGTEGVDGARLDTLLRDVRGAASSQDDADTTLAVMTAMLRQFLAIEIISLDEDEISERYFDLILSGRTFHWKQEEVCRAVALWLLDSLGRQPSRQISVLEFKQQWLELIPETWAHGCDVVAVAVSLQTVKLRTTDQGVEHLEITAGSAPDAMTIDTPGAVESAAQKKRKWHEKFGAQRNVR